ncbi:MAG: glycoside hydrolase family 88 protein [Candidatus Marinimicrobia bacterium]|jgi:unsaturated rhamnogalacturonyl hydrolase|nr:glycoside hydrolase family 88 protein [Candidatus Neomarinimicrobiota bacterium]
MGINYFVYTILLVIVLGACSKQSPDVVTSEPEALAIHMAHSQMARSATSLKIGGSDPKAKWRYTTGLFLSSLLRLHDEVGDTASYLYAKRVIDSFIGEDGSIAKFKMSDYNIDNINSGKSLLRFYKKTGEDKYRLASDLLREQLRGQPRTSEGGFWHKKRYPWQMWLDGIYMGSPFYAAYGKMFGEPDAFDDVVNQVVLIDRYTRHHESGLRYHAWDESGEQAWADSITGCSSHFWGRGMGWYAMALVDILDWLPDGHQGRDTVLTIFKDVMEAVRIVQDEKTGVWYQVLDLHNREGNYLEASASSMFTYAYAKGLNKSYLDQRFESVARKAWAGVIETFIELDSEGNLHLNHCCSGAGLGGKPYRDGSFEYYMSEPVISNDLKGVGPFIMAALEMQQLVDEM